MKPAARGPVYNASDLARLPDDGSRHELEAGRLLAEPLPTHNHDRLRRRVERLLYAFVAARGLGEVFGEAGYLLARNPDTVRGPDVSFVAKERLGGFDGRRFFAGAPDLAVEILSPSNRPAEIRAKVADYLAAGSRLVWVLDPDRKAVTVYRTLLETRRLGPGESVEGEDVLPGFAERVEALFEPPAQAPGA